MSCPLTTTISFNDFYSAKRRSDGLFDRVAVNMGVELTHRCNLACVHCYLQDAEQDNVAPGQGEMTTVEVEHLLDESAELGVLWVLFTGGEAMVRPDFSHLYMYAKRAGMFVCVFTNGTVLTDAIADMFVEYPPTSIEVTVHSMDASVFDSITRVPGSFERCMAGIERLRSRGLRFSLKSVALRGTHLGLVDVQAFAEELGAGYRFDSNVLPQRGSGVPPEGQRLSPHEVVALDKSFPDRMDGWCDVYRLSGRSSEDRIFSCGAGLKSFWVDPMGRMTMCALTYFVTYDLRSGTLRDAWNHFVPREILRAPGDDYPCGGCELDAICGRCPGWSAAEMDSVDAPVPYLCEVGRIRRDAILEHRGPDWDQTQVVDPEALVGHGSDSPQSNVAVPFE